MAIEDTNSTRVMGIRKAIEQQLQPRHIEIVDESHLHAGHAGARDGKGHFKIIIAADKLDAKKPIEQHKIDDTNPSLRARCRSTTRQDC